MINYYLVPAQITTENGEPSRSPKYVGDLKLNWAGVYIETKDCYVMVVNSINPIKLNSLKSQVGVVELDNSKQTKQSVGNILNIPLVSDGDDLVEVVAKLQEPLFTKDKIWVDSD